MAVNRQRVGSSDTRRRPPALTPEAKENQMIALAVDLAEQQLRDGSASSQVLTHYLKLATTREKLEQEKLARENELLRARSEQLASSQHIEKMYSEALEAMRSYQGHEIPDDGYDDDAY